MQMTCNCTSFSPSEVATASVLINRDLHSLYQVSYRHLLTINSSKSFVIIFGNKNFRDTAKNSLHLIVNDVPTPFSDSARELGLYIDYQLRFGEHVTCMLRKAYMSLKLIFAQRHCLNTDVKKSLCEALVLSHFNHFDVAYVTCLDSIQSQP